MFGATLVWVLVIGDVPTGYFKTKDACIDAFRQAIVVFDDEVRPLSKQAGGMNPAAATCVTVENPLVK